MRRWGDFRRRCHSTMPSKHINSGSATFPRMGRERGNSKWPISTTKSVVISAPSIETSAGGMMAVGIE